MNLVPRQQIVLGTMISIVVIGGSVRGAFAGGRSVVPDVDLNLIAAVQKSAGSNDDAIESFSGNVSWYGARFHGRKTASGEIFNMNKPTAAHRTLKFFRKVLVENPKTGRSVIVKVNDRGPYVRGRVMDVSREGARRLGTLLSGVVYCDCLVLDDD